jgi:putative nucleotidyltransferase with HDIG domain
MDKILVVDDNEQNIEIMKDLLSSWGYDVYIAVEGNEAFHMAYGCRPDVIILDVMLPGMNGFEICRKLKNDIVTKSIPVIMVTALNEVEDRIRGFNVGADVFLSKPIIYQELRNRISWVIDSKKVFNNMEHKNHVVKSFLEIMRLIDNDLYVHACTVKAYCEKVGKVLFVTDEKLEQLLIAAQLHDIGKIISKEPEEHMELGVSVISSLRMYEWLKVFIRNHHEKMNGKGFPDALTKGEMSQELKILITVNRFVELFERKGVKDKSIQELSDECAKGYWSIEVLEAIKQVLKDEKFIKSINYNKQKESLEPFN